MINNIKSISYDYKREVMILNLKKRQLYKGYNVNVITVECSYEVFLEKTEKWIKEKYENNKFR